MPGFNEGEMPGVTPPDNRVERAVEVREATIEDVPEMHALFRTAWAQTYVGEKYGVTEEQVAEHFDNQKDTSEEMQGRWAKSIENPDAGVRFFVATEGDRIVGFTRSAVKEAKGETPAHNILLLMYVDAASKDVGVGSKLLQQLDEKHFQADLPTRFWTAQQNEDARMKGESAGFHATSKVGNIGVVEGKKIPSLMMERPPKA